MSDKKGVGRKAVVAFGIICLIFLSVLVSFAYYSASTINNRDTQIETLADQKDQLQTWLEGNITLLDQTQIWLDGNATLLEQTQAWLQDNITHYDSVIWALNAQIATLDEQIDILAPRVAFFNWVDETNATGIDFAYELYPNATVIDDNATYGVKNGAPAGRMISVWAESCNATEWISDFKIEILDATGLYKITVPIVTSFDNTSIIYKGKIGWSQPPDTIFTMRVIIKGKASVTPGSITQVHLRLESRVFPHP